mmetsp:Transcript_16858/g.27975  ORF Transcript_16858/g.27975 Transcript_16858/m.27975 type:complete len:112 (+) Transcript_16858:238-573(+)
MGSTLERDVPPSATDIGSSSAAVGSGATSVLGSLSPCGFLVLTPEVRSLFALGTKLECCVRQLVHPPGDQRHLLQPKDMGNDMGRWAPPAPSPAGPPPRALHASGRLQPCC